MRAGLYQLLVLPLLWLVFTPLLLTVIFATLLIWPTAKVESKSTTHLPQAVETINNQTQPTLNFTQSDQPTVPQPTLSYRVATTTGTATITVSATNPITDCTAKLTGKDFSQVITESAAADSSGCKLTITNLDKGDYQFSVSATKLNGTSAKTFGGFTVF